MRISGTLETGTHKVTSRLMWGNADIKWETSQQTNVGLDMSFFKNSLDVSMDFYVKKTSDMLLNMPIPSFGAFPNSPFFNAGDLKNTGFEIVVNYRNQIGKDFNYNVGLNMSTYKTEVTKLTSEYLSGNTSRTYVGGLSDVLGIQTNRNIPESGRDRQLCG